MEKAKNVLGTALKDCSTDPMTGFYRTGCCDTGPEDRGLHVVCAQMTTEFLQFSKAMGNDLTTPLPEYGFQGLKPGDRWCLCAARWQEALEHKVAPPIILSASHEKALEIVGFDDLMAHALAEVSN